MYHPTPPRGDLITAAPTYRSPTSASPTTTVQRTTLQNVPSSWIDRDLFLSLIDVAAAWCSRGHHLLLSLLSSCFGCRFLDYFRDIYSPTPTLRGECLQNRPHLVPGLSSTSPPSPPSSHIMRDTACTRMPGDFEFVRNCRLLAEPMKTKQQARHARRLLHIVNARLSKRMGNVLTQNCFARPTCQSSSWSFSKESYEATR